MLSLSCLKLLEDSPLEPTLKMKFHTRSAITLLPFATSVLSQSSTSFTDPDNAITFQAYTSKSDGGGFISIAHSAAASRSFRSYNWARVSSN